MSLAIIDNSALRFLEKPAAARSLVRSLDSAGVMVGVTEVNLLEAVAAHPQRRSRLLGTLRILNAGRPVLPWTFQVLRDEAIALARREPRPIYGESGKEYLLEDDERAEAQREVAAAFNRQQIEFYKSALLAQRKRIQDALRERGALNEFADVRAFLDGGWLTSDLCRGLAADLWSRFELPGEPNPDLLLQHDAWRLLLEAEGYAIYEYTAAVQQRPVPGRFDLVQLPYLGLATKRILITHDGAQLRMAHEILTGRYENARSVNITDLL